ncbi:MAG: sensor histidine kinase N-terminal domain-containing protein [Rhodanobacteraceae bacterium]
MTAIATRRKRFSLRARLTWMLALSVLVILGGAARVVDWRADTEMQQRFDASLLARAQSLAALVQVENGKLDVDADNAATAVFPGNADTSWYALQCGGAVVARTAEVPPVMATGVAPRFTNAKMPGHRLLRVVALRFKPAHDGAGPLPNAPTCVLRYGLDRRPLDDILHTLDFILLGSLLGACVLVLLLTPLLVRRGLRPLSVLDHAMAGIGPDAPGGRLPDSDTTELASLVARFNEVLARMDEGLARERRFASGLAHEFRTRLAELRMLVDVERRYPSGRDVHSLLGEVGNIGTELEATVTALLQLTRIESGLEQTQREDVTLATLLARIAARHQESAHARGVSIKPEFADDAVETLAADSILLEIVLDNLLGNAVAYAPVGTQVTLRGARDGITVGNAAPALHPDDLGNFGQRFWRKDAQGAGHAGLGLALAGAAARALKMSLAFTLDDGVLHAALRWLG